MRIGRVLGGGRRNSSVGYWGDVVGYSDEMTAGEAVLQVEREVVLRRLETTSRSFWG